MRAANLLKIELYLLCEDKALNTDNVVAGFMKNIEAMHNREYITLNKDGSVEERVKLFGATTVANDNIVNYIQYEK